MIKLFSFCAFSIILCMSFEACAIQGNKMDSKKFDFITYGLIKKNELSVTLHLLKGSADELGKVKAKDNISKPQLTPEIVEPKIDEVISVWLEYKNISSREIHIEDRLWFIRLKVVLNDKPIDYIGPMVSMPPPSKSDFKSLKPEESFKSEAVNLNSYYSLPNDVKGSLRVEYSHHSNVDTAFATLTTGN